MRHVFVAAVAALLFTTAGYAQETPGAGRFEISAVPGGAMFFTSTADDNEPDFGNYVLGGSLTVNLNRWIGFEGEGGSLVGIRQRVNFGGLAFTDQYTPTMFAYTGNVLVSPMGSDRALVPYLTGGVGGLTLFDSDDVANLGITSNTTFLTGNVGGGLKWYAKRFWGVRADYRFTMVDGKATAPAFFGREARYGHRVSGGLILNF